MPGGSAPARPLALWVPPFLFLVNFLVYYLSAQPLLDDPDVPWHLATGRYILDTGSIPNKDPWSFAADDTWYLLSWVWNLLLGLAEAAFGLFGVLVFCLALTAGLVSMLAWHLIRSGIGLSTVFFICLVSALCMLDFITARPHLSGYVLSFVFYLICHASRGKASVGSLFALPPLMLVWANTHGSFMAGFIVIAAFALEAFALRQFQWLRRLLVVWVSCFVLSLINPYGLEVSIGALKTLAGTAKGHTIEWLPFAFTASTGISAWLLLFIFSSNLRFARVPLADKYLVVAWLIACMMIMRNGPMFVLLSATYVARCLEDATADLREERPPSRFIHMMERIRPACLWALSIALVGVFCLVAERLPHQDKLLSPGADISDAIAYASEHYPDHRYLTDFNFGGQVIYRTMGTLPFMMDSRAATVYSEDTMADYIRFMYQQPGWSEGLARHGVNALMIANTQRFAQAYENGDFSDRWQLVFAGKVANVYIARP